MPLRAQDDPVELAPAGLDHEIRDWVPNKALPFHPLAASGVEVRGGVAQDRVRRAGSLPCRIERV